MNITQIQYTHTTHHVPHTHHTHTTYILYHYHTYYTPLPGQVKAGGDAKLEATFTGLYGSIKHMTWSYVTVTGKVFHYD